MKDACPIRLVSFKVQDTYPVESRPMQTLHKTIILVPIYARGVWQRPYLDRSLNQ
ncbi:hypothetical protein Mal33_54900 [Rosistilla oblonga]|uniref:Uncharacterized protein n=1 Tax=Rosistilla oblonga TaxID=2527990 RepID=A0A518J289_9BACT|nr:hypothetical protein Mal33_54900 [Rosistilla oblonga]